MSDSKPAPMKSRSRPLAPPIPPYRKLRVYSVDPGLATSLKSREIRETTLKIEWEENLGLGPTGEYLEVIDVDPASGLFYPPVNLNDAYILAMDGLSVSEGNPQFHQQMVYAVSMNTIEIFERALGRASLWSPIDFRTLKKLRTSEEPKNWKDRAHWYLEAPAQELGYVQRLRIHPHALRQPNAFYSPEKKALLFGYFQATDKDPENIMPGSMTFGCLSFDVIAHETTHALLDGLHRRYTEPTNEDSLAFHEAFADIVALFQHFSLQDVVRSQIAKTRGDLKTNNLLGQLAVQFGQASGHYGALRNYITTQEGEEKWVLLQKTTEVHDRGAILVAAVFDAFLNIYAHRTADLVRIASEGSGILRPGELHPDLVNRLADEASKAAGHVLNICIRALDYCPPIDITFGEYLQAIITADCDLVPDDPMGYRAAFIEAFRRRGIYPRGIRTLSEESLRWSQPLPRHVELLQPALLKCIEVFGESMTNLARGNAEMPIREKLFRSSKVVQCMLHKIIEDLAKSFDKPDANPDGFLCLKQVLGIDLAPDASGKVPKFEVHSARALHRVGPDGQVKRDIVLEITQQTLYERLSDGQLVPTEYDDGPEPAPNTPAYYSKLLKMSRRMIFRGGATLLVDMETGKVRYSVIKSIPSGLRLKRQAEFIFGDHKGRSNNYFWSEEDEPFALIHSVE